MPMQPLKTPVSLPQQSRQLAPPPPLPSPPPSPPARRLGYVSVGNRSLDAALVRWLDARHLQPCDPSAPVYFVPFSPNGIGNKLMGVVMGFHMALMQVSRRQPPPPNPAPLHPRPKPTLTAAPSPSNGTRSRPRPPTAGPTARGLRLASAHARHNLPAGRVSPAVIVPTSLRRRHDAPEGGQVHGDRVPGPHVVRLPLFAHAAALGAHVVLLSRAAVGVGSPRVAHVVARDHPGASSPPRDATSPPSLLVADLCSTASRAGARSRSISYARARSSSLASRALSRMCSFSARRWRPERPRRTSSSRGGRAARVQAPSRARALPTGSPPASRSGGT